MSGWQHDDLAEGPVWNDAWSPPPWSAEAPEEGEDHGTGWRVMCDGYNDETPLVCTGTESWPLAEADAHILAAGLEMLAALRALVADGFPMKQALAAQVTAAIAKAEGG